MLHNGKSEDQTSYNAQNEDQKSYKDYGDMDEISHKTTNSKYKEITNIFLKYINKFLTLHF